MNTFLRHLWITCWLVIVVFVMISAGSAAHEKKYDKATYHLIVLIILLKTSPAFRKTSQEKFLGRRGVPFKRSRPTPRPRTKE